MTKSFQPLNFELQENLFAFLGPIGKKPRAFYNSRKKRRKKILDQKCQENSVSDSPRRYIRESGASEVSQSRRNR
jgi:hypothetical protein